MSRWRPTAAYRIAFAHFLAFAIGLAVLGAVVFEAMHVAFLNQRIPRTGFGLKVRIRGCHRGLKCCCQLFIIGLLHDSILVHRAAQGMPSTTTEPVLDADQAQIIFLILSRKL